MGSTPGNELSWRKSSFSGSQNCVEVALDASRAVHVRDSKAAGGPVLTFTPDEWTAFLQGMSAGEFGFDALGA